MGQKSLRSVGLGARARSANGAHIDGMPSLPGRLRKAFAIALIFLNLSGARVISVTEAFAGSRTYFTADRGVKAILKAATKQTWRKKGGLCVSDVVRSAKIGRAHV